MGKTVLVTGGTGFIGTHLIDYLNEKEYETINLSTNSRHPNAAKNIRFDLLSNDISNIIDNLKFNYLIHLAAVSSPMKAKGKSEITYNLNVRATKELLESVKDKHLEKIVYLSSILTDKKDNAYSITKLLSEIIADEYLEKGLPIIIFKLGNCYGPGQDNSFFIPEKILEGLKGHITIRYGGGTTKNLIYIDDVTRAIEESLNTNYKGKVNLTSNHKIDNTTIGKFIANKTNAYYNIKKSSKIVNLRESGINARDVLNWEPITSFEEGIIKTIKYYKNKK